MLRGWLTVWKKFNHAVSNTGEQIPPEGIGVDRFEFWVPERRPGGPNLALSLSQALSAYEPENVIQGYFRPVSGSHAWVADPADPSPTLELHWQEPQSIREIVLYWDTDFDHAMESAQLEHSEDVMPVYVRSYVLYDAEGFELHRCDQNHQTINRIAFEKPMRTQSLTLKIEHPSDHSPAALFGIRVYSKLTADLSLP